MDIHRNQVRRAACAAALCIMLAAAACSREEPQAAVRSSEPGREKSESAPAAEAPKPAAEAEPARPGQSVLGAPGDYVTTVVGALDKTKLRTGLIQVRDFVKKFHLMEGRYPASLEELAEWVGALPELPRGYSYRYDPSTGGVALVSAR